MNFNTRGFTEKGLVKYGQLRSKGIDKEKAVEILINEDKSKDSEGLNELINRKAKLVGIGELLKRIENDVILLETKVKNFKENIANLEKELKKDKIYDIEINKKVDSYLNEGYDRKRDDEDLD